MIHFRESRQEPDGSWTFFGVPILAAQPGIDGEWMERAIAHGAERERDGFGYLAPLHLRGVSLDQRTCVGFVRLVGTDEGETGLRLLADFVGVTEAGARAIKDPRCIVSAEVFDIRRSARIDCVALVPFAMQPDLDKSPAK